MLLTTDRILLNRSLFLHPALHIIKPFVPLSGNKCLFRMMSFSQFWNLKNSNLHPDTLQLRKVALAEVENVPHTYPRGWEIFLRNCNTQGNFEKLVDYGNFEELGN